MNHYIVNTAIQDLIEMPAFAIHQSLAVLYNIHLVHLIVSHLILNYVISTTGRTLYVT